MPRLKLFGLMMVVLSANVQAIKCTAIDGCVQQLVKKHYLHDNEVPKRLRHCEIASSPALAIVHPQADLAVFSTISACGAGSNVATELLLLRKTTKGFELVSHLAVGGKWLSIAPDFIAIVEARWIYVQLSSWPQLENDALPIKENYYYQRYLFEHEQLQRVDTDIYIQDNHRFMVVQAIVN